MSLAVTPSRKRTSRKSHVYKAIFAKLSGTWLCRGSYGNYNAVRASFWLLRGLRPALFAEIALSGS